jgi:predicted DsbA family dithiol-disulfide isomerase
MTALPIDMVSDVVCPWCFIGKRRLEKAIALKPEIPIEVRFHPFFLNPWVPREGISREEYLVTKFGSVEGYNKNAQRVTQAAAAEGLTYSYDKIKRQPNTLDCHRLIRWAGEIGTAAAMKQRLMDLYFTQGGDLTERETLVKAAADCGLNAVRVRELLAGEQDIDRVSADAKAASDAGISGVPCFIFGGALAVSGAQSPEHLAQAIERAAQEFANREAAE